MKINILLKLACIMLLIPFPSIISRAATVNVRDTVYGTVVDQNFSPIPGVKVQIEGRSEYAYTDIDGRFRILCSPNAKRVIVSFPKMPEISKKIKPGMVVRIERLAVSNRSEWFLGANVGLSLLSAKTEFGDGLGSSSHILDKHDNYKGVNFSIMGGRVKKIGWYAKYQLSTTSQFTLHGPSAGAVFRLGCPVYLGIFS